MTVEIDTLAADCLAHLECEESCLESLCIVVESMRESLLSRNNDGIRDLLERHSSVAVKMEEISRNRSLLRKRISEAFGVVEGAATVGLVAGQCDGEVRPALEDLRSRLRTVAENLNKLLIANSNLAMQLLELFENVFRTLSGDQARSPRYERTGRPSIL